MSKMLKAALWYQRRGVSVFPICPDKKVPLVAWKPYQGRCATPVEITKWWHQKPLANIGMACGEVSGVTVTDCDTADAIKKIESFLPDNFLIPTVETPKGGRHYYFEFTTGMKNWVGVFPGVDIRTTGGQVLLPPSVKGEKKYRWLDGLAIHQVKRPPMPEKLRLAIIGAMEREKPIQNAKKADPGAYGAAALAKELTALAGASKGERNSRLNQAAYSLGQLVAGGEIDAGQVEAALTSMALSLGLSATETANTIKSGLSGGAAKPRKKQSILPNRQNKHRHPFRINRRFLERRFA
jgi:hypothetical protein